MIDLKWTTLAFEQLEALPDSLAFEIVRRADILPAFPEMGVSLRYSFATALNYRQLLIKRRWRLIYRYDARKAVIYIAAVQSCRQQLPLIAELEREIKKTQP